LANVEAFGTIRCLIGAFTI